jgi:hypothetical protein
LLHETLFGAVFGFWRKESTGVSTRRREVVHLYYD